VSSDDRQKAVNTTQAAELLGIPTRSVRRLIATKEIRAVRLGRYLVIPIEELDRLLASSADEAPVSA
jgi:excisionase family DNA binding protein